MTDFTQTGWLNTHRTSSILLLISPWYRSERGTLSHYAMLRNPLERTLGERVVAEEPMESSKEYVHTYARQPVWASLLTLAGSGLCRSVGRGWNWRTESPLSGHRVLTQAWHSDSHLSTRVYKTVYRFEVSGYALGIIDKSMLHGVAMWSF